MRLWTLHPKYLDTRGLVALWRESLLARAVLANKTRGYTNHPQLLRFRESTSPLNSVDRYLDGVFDEATRRGFRFDASKLGSIEPGLQLTENRGQLEYEWAHLLAKLESRAPAEFLRLQSVDNPEPHPLFKIVPGPVRTWEKQWS
ncbi:MAG: pyrimidine dimer DNA glycosylase/endonuclease V [Gemmatimonadales bacterium]